MDLRFGILAAGETVCQAHWRSIEQLQALQGVTCAAVIQAGEQPALSFGARSAAGCRPVDLRAHLSEPRRVGASSVKDVGLDFILNCTFLPPDRLLFEAATHAVWMFFYGNPAWPPAWGEIDRGDLLTHVTLRRLSNSPAVLGQCIIPTDRTSYRSNLNNALVAGIDLPARAVKHLRAGRTPKISARAVSEPPGNLSLAGKARVLVRMIGSWSAVQLRSMFFSEDWNVGIVEAPIAAFLDPAFRPQVAWLPRHHGRARFVADPFSVPAGNGLTLLVEEFDNDRYQGFLSAIDWVPGAAAPAPRLMIDEGVHMSYPFPVEHGGELFLMPETSVKREVALYRRDPSTAVWGRTHQLISNFAALDPTVIQHQGRWWMFCSSQDELPECKLYLFYSDDLLGPWIPHPLNPVKCDGRSSRPGGTPFVADGKLYRPAQDATHGYGGAVTINLVKVLTPEEFEEEAVCGIGPIAGSLYQDGLHTLSAAGPGRTLIDGKRLVFTPERTPRRVLHKLRRIGQVLFRR